MKSKIISLIISVLVCTYSITAQGEAAISVLSLTQSPQSIGMGQVGVSITKDDPAAFYINPAILGYQAWENNFSSTIYTQKADWLSGLGVTYNVFSFNLGYNLKNTFDYLPLAIGFGYSTAEMDYGTFVQTGPFSPTPIGTFNSYDKYSTYSLGLGLDYYVRLSLGVSIKNIESKLGAQVLTADSTHKEVKVETEAFDYGFLMEVPISSLLLENVNWKIDERNFLSPKSNFAFGFSVNNIGDEIYYIDPNQSDPLPRTSRLGYNFNFGIDLTHNTSKINLIDYTFFAEAEDILIKRNLNEVEYQSFMSDLDFGKNLINLEGDQNIILHKAHMIELFEMIKLTSGSYSGRGFGYIPKSSGFAISSKGVFKILNILINNTIVKFINEHIVLEYVKSTNSKGNQFESDFSSFNIYVKNFYF